jgi:DNA processing protein
MSKNAVIKIKKNESKFSKRLKQIPDCPKEIYAIGNIKLLNEKNILAVVGSRRPSEYGLKAARTFSRTSAENGVVIVSGLAIGIDAEAHRAALDAPGKTIAILGSAIDDFYPAVNQRLAQKIIASNGLIVSEYPPGSPTYPGNFPLRNRIIAGLSDATLVVEAAEKSGSLITAFLAAQYNRDVFAIPGNIDRVLSRGTNYLIKKGARLASRVDDFSEYFGIKSNKNVNRDLRLTLEEAKIINILETGEQSFDQLVKLCALDAKVLNSALLTLEMKEFIRNFNGQFSLAENAN